jgi:hypothetical protein
MADAAVPRKAARIISVAAIGFPARTRSLARRIAELASSVISVFP